jgi:hypothetical protein
MLCAGQLDLVCGCVQAADMGDLLVSVHLPVSSLSMQSMNVTAMSRTAIQQPC